MKKAWLFWAIVGLIMLLMVVCVVKIKAQTLPPELWEYPEDSERNEAIRIWEIVRPMVESLIEAKIDSAMIRREEIEDSLPKSLESHWITLATWPNAMVELRRRGQCLTIRQWADSEGKIEVALQNGYWTMRAYCPTADTTSFQPFEVPKKLITREPNRMTPAQSIKAITDIANSHKPNRFDEPAERAVRAMSNPCLDSVAVWYVDTLGFRKDTVYFRFPFEHEVKEFWIVNIPIIDTVVVGYFLFEKGVDKLKLQIGGK